MCRIEKKRKKERDENENNMKKINKKARKKRDQDNNQWKKIKEKKERGKLIPKKRKEYWKKIKNELVIKLKKTGMTGNEKNDRIEEKKKLEKVQPPVSKSHSKGPELRWVPCGWPCCSHGENDFRF